MHNGPIQFLCWSAPSMDRILSACGGGVVRESAVSGGSLQSLWHNKAAKGQVLAVAFDDRFVVSSSSETPAINFYDRNAKDEKNKKVQLAGVEQAVRTLAIDGQRKALLSGSDDGIIIVWNYKGLEDGQNPVSLLQVQAHRASISSMVLERDGKGAWERIFTCAGDNSIFTIDFQTDRDSHTHQVRNTPTLFTLVASTGTLFSNNGNECDIWNTRKMLHKSEYQDGGPGVVRGHKEAIIGLQYYADDQKLVTASADQTLRVWDLAFYDEGEMAREELITAAGTMEMRYQIQCMSECFGQVVGIGMAKSHHQGGAVQVINFVSIGGAEAPEVISNFFTTTPPQRISFVGVPNEEITHIIVQLADGEVVVYELSGKLVRTLIPAPDGRQAASLSVPYLEWANDKYDPPRHVMVSCRDDLIKEIVIRLDGHKAIVDVTTEWATRCGAPITCSALVQQAGIYAVVGLADGTFKALDQYGKITHSVAWDGGTSEEAAEKQMVANPRPKRRQSYCNAMAHHDTACASSVEASPALRYVVMGFDDGCVQLWDTTMRRVTRRFYAHTERITRTLMLPSTRRVLSATEHSVRFDILDVREDSTAQSLYSPKGQALQSVSQP